MKRINMYVCMYVGRVACGANAAGTGMKVDDENGTEVKLRSSCFDADTLWDSFTPIN